MPGQTIPRTPTTTEEESESAKGLKAGTEVAIGCGTFDMDTFDDAIHSNNSVTITGGKLAIAAGDDGIHGDSAILTKGGDITIRKSYKGMESKIITIAEGNIEVNASDDGINIGGGNDGSKPDMQSTSSENLLLSIKRRQCICKCRGGWAGFKRFYFDDGRNSDGQRPDQCWQRSA
ncbi:carbohydrate-binding domain-containing protein [Neobacillus drentensis]|uniref:carbohydrate-binding domain-containing protein n=1 Tax=Neobacillus drentensis TaxID=220684 RepID=UPI0030032BF0